MQILHEGSSATPWVMYVGDRAVNIMLLEAIFERRPHLHLVVATSSQRALHLAGNLKPALVLIDLELTDGDALPLLGRLRDLPGCADVPAVAVSADHDMELAGTDFVELWGKPLGPRLVFSRLDELTATRETRTTPPTHKPLPVRLHPDERPAVATLH